MSKLKVFFQILAGVSSGLIGAAGTIGQLVPNEQPDSKIGFLIFLASTFSIELIGVGVIGLLGIAAYCLGVFDWVVNQLRIIFSGNAYGLQVGIGRKEKILARTLVALTLTATTAGVLWALIPAARLTGSYIKHGILMLDYRNAILLQAQAAIEQGDLEAGSTRFKEFAKIFPEHKEDNRIDERVAVLNARRSAAMQMDRQADLLEKRYGNSMPVLSLRAQALRLHANDGKLREKVQRSLDVLPAYAATFVRVVQACPSGKTGEKDLGQALVLLGFDQQPESIAGSGSLPQRFQRFCKVFSDWNQKNIEQFVERVWKTKEVRELLVATSLESRLKPPSPPPAKSAKRAKPGTGVEKTESTEISDADAIRSRQFPNGPPKFLLPIRMDENPDITRNMRIFENPGQSFLMCWVDANLRQVSLDILRKNTTQYNLKISEGCPAEAFPNAPVDVKDFDRDKRQAQIKLVQRAISQKAERKESVNAFCQVLERLSVTQASFVGLYKPCAAPEISVAK